MLPPMLFDVDEGLSCKGVLVHMYRSGSGMIQWHLQELKLRAACPLSWGTKGLCCWQGTEFDEEKAAEEEQWGAPRNEAGRWASCVRIIDSASLQTARCFLGPGLTYLSCMY